MEDPPDKPPLKGLKRLDQSYYRGENWVHWNMTMNHRSTGWLSKNLHLQLREAMLHTLIRYRIASPVYCLMPDHGHFLWGGLSDRSDQINATKFFRQEWNRILKNHKGDQDFQLQHQSYDHVLRDDELNRTDGFQNMAGYILENPVRAGLVENFREWEFTGSVVPAFPRIDPREEDFWDRYWKMHYSLRDSFLDEQGRV